MTESLDSDKLDKRLWRQFASQAQKPQAPQIDPNTLAAYLDGSADPQQIEMVEARLAVDPDFLAQLTDLRRIAEIQTHVVPASVLARARSLGHRRIWPTRIRWAAAAAGIMLACLLGYNVGSTTGQNHRSALTAGSTQVSFQLDDLISDPAIGIILPFNGSNGR